MHKVLTNTFTVCFIAAIGICRCLVNGQDTEELDREWNTILKAHREERDIARTLELKYQVREEYSSPEPVQLGRLSARMRKVVRNVEYATAGSKYFQDAAADYYDADGVLIGGATFHNTIGYNGKRASVRESSRPKYFYMKQAGRLFVPPPGDVLMPATPDTIHDMLRKGILTLRDVQRPEANRVVVTVGSATKGDVCTIEFAPDKGWLAVKSEQRDGRSMIVSESELTQIERVQSADGNEVFIPVSGTSKVFSNGQEQHRLALEVDRASIRINHEIPASRFELSPLPDEKVFNIDIMDKIPTPEESSRKSVADISLDPVKSASTLPSTQPTIVASAPIYAPTPPPAAAPDSSSSASPWPGLSSGILVVVLIVVVITAVLIMQRIKRPVQK